MTPKDSDKAIKTIVTTLIEGIDDAYTALRDGDHREYLEVKDEAEKEAEDAIKQLLAQRNEVDLRSSVVLPEKMKLDMQLKPGEFDLIQKELDNKLSAELIEKIIFIKVGGWQEAIDAMAKLNPNSKEELDPFDYVEPCEPECSDVRHSYHKGQWDMAVRIESALNNKNRK